MMQKILRTTAILAALFALMAMNPATAEAQSGSSHHKKSHAKHGKKKKKSKSGKSKSKKSKKKKSGKKSKSHKSTSHDMGNDPSMNGDANKTPPLGGKPDVDPITSGDSTAPDLPPAK